MVTNPIKNEYYKVGLFEIQVNEILNDYSVRGYYIDKDDDYNHLFLNRELIELKESERKFEKINIEKNEIIEQIFSSFPNNNNDKAK